MRTGWGVGVVKINARSHLKSKVFNCISKYPHNKFLYYCSIFNTCLYFDKNVKFCFQMSAFIGLRSTL